MEKDNSEFSVDVILHLSLQAVILSVVNFIFLGLCVMLMLMLGLHSLFVWNNCLSHTLTL